ncbi:unnamed protein product [Clonostachys rhizophaga]|uniref:Short-chain dehydrogenase/reductase 3 n=1 Tax=Clonostachys rhizophaga TaxID=160324 RepID=A0A9N9VK26_9HYPO|nr:unnamed protein product [Clonostachys rhizophaga]
MSRFSPLLPASLLAAVTFAPGTAQYAASALSAYVPIFSRLDWLFGSSTRIKATLGVLFALDAIRWLNRTLNNMSYNAWRFGSVDGWDWPNEIALVTGGSGGIGQLLTERLHALGMRVIVLDLQELPKSLRDKPGISFYKCDLTNPQEVADAADAVRAEVGHPSIVINNAGLCRLAPILQTSADDVQKVFGVNCIALWLTTKQFLPNMIRQNKGHIMTIASIASFIALPRAGDYSASKAASLAFHETLATELKFLYQAPNVLTTTFHPNFVRTPLIKDFQHYLEEAGHKFLEPDFVADKIVAQLLRKQGGRIVLPEEQGIITGVRAWPAWIQQLIRDSFGPMSVIPGEKFV